MSSEEKKNKVYVLHCGACGFHTRTDGTQFKLHEIKRASVPTGVPKKDGNKINTPDPSPRKKMFRCPKCGRGIAATASKVKIIPHLEQQEEKKDEEKNQSTRRETGTFGRTIPPDFTG